MSRPRRPVVVDAVARDADAVTGRVRVEGLDDPIELRRLGDETYRVTMDERVFEVVVARGATVDWGWVDDRTYRWPRRPSEDDAPVGAADAPIVASTPATVSEVTVAEGQAVARGDTLVVLEAMKMEIPLRAPRDGRVSAVLCAAGDQVDADVPLVELDALDQS